MADEVRHRVTVAGSGESFEIVEGDRILAAARRAGIWFPFECGWGGCSTCKATVVEGETRLLFEGAPAVDARDARRRRVILCQSTATSDLVLKPTWAEPDPRPGRATEDHRARLDVVEPLGPGLARFTFGLERPAEYLPGQFAIIEVAAGLRRSYSMAGLPGQPSVEFIAKRYLGGAGSEQLFALPVGSEVHVELPYGDFWLRDADRPVLLVAGGTGISAVLAVVRQLAARSDHREVHVCYGAAGPADLVCWDELTELVSGLPRGRVHGALLTPDDGWTGAVGHVTEALAPLLPALGDAEVYLAGPPPMARAVRHVVSEAGIQLDRVHVDSFG